MTTQPHKFLMIVNDRAWFWSHRLPLAKAILEQGYDLHLAMNGAADDAGIKALGITGHNLPAHTGSFNPIGQGLLCGEIFSVLRQVKPDIVHAITVRHAFFTGLASRLTKTRRVVFTIAGLGPLLNSDHPKIRAVRALVVPLLKLAFKGRGRFIIFQNSDDAKALLKVGAAERGACAVIRGSGVDPAQFAYHPEVLSERPIVLFSSRLLKAKGICEFVHAARILKSKGIAGAVRHRG